MGSALAAAILASGNTPVVISGPVEVAYPSDAEVHYVTTTEEMRDSAVALFGECVGVFGAAAPCDFMPKNFAPQKIKRREQYELSLIPTPDILATLGKCKRADQFIVAFALETENGRANALEKAQHKKADFIVLNAPETINAEDATIEVITTSGTTIAHLCDSKINVARQLLHLILYRHSTLRNQ